METIGQCTFCKKTDAILIDFSDQGQDFPRRYAVKCCNCGAVGPAGPTPESAIWLWNSGLEGEELHFSTSGNGTKSSVMMQRSLRWISQNKDAWRRIENMARKDAHERGRTRMKAYIEAVRNERNTRHLCEDYYKVCNSYSSYFNRILAAWSPELALYIPMSKASKAEGMVVPERDSIL